MMFTWEIRKFRRTLCRSVSKWTHFDNMAVRVNYGHTVYSGWSMEIDIPLPQGSKWPKVIKSGMNYRATARESCIQDSS